MGQEIAGRPLEILLIEDNPGDVRLTAEMLKQAKLLNRLTVAVDGEQALAMLQHSGVYAHQPLPDLILLDLNLPGLDGRDLLDRIKESPGLARIPVVVLTQSGADADVRRAYDAYACCYVRKPLDIDQFLGVMQSVGHFWLSVVSLPGGGGRADALPVLLVEDEAGDARLVCELLREVEPRYALQTVATLAEALRQLAQQRYAAVLLDLGLPDSQGLPTLRAMLQAAGPVPLVVLSGRDDETVAIRAIQLGAQDYVVKGRGDGQHLARALRYAIERKLVQEHLEFVASHDNVTGLPNRRRFIETLRQLLPSLRRQGSSMAVLVLALTGLGAVNQSLGHEIGDLSLKAAVGRMQRLMPEGTLLACSGSAEFALALADTDAMGVAAQLAENLLDALRLPYRVGEHEFYLGSQIGLSVCPGDADEAATLLKCAETAMYQAGQRGGISAIDFYSPELNREVQGRLALERELRQALARDELQLEYQPIVDRHGRIVSAEALLRWEHPQRGRLSPDQFLPLAEQSELIHAIGRWVLRQATRQAAQWGGLTPQPPSVAVNVSAHQLAAGNLLHDVHEALEDSGLPASRLELELTESVMQRADTRDILSTLRERGIAIAIDDFGTGFSSLSYLKAFPVDVIKIDRSFVTDAIVDARDAVIVRAIIAMAHILGIDVVAEGVESERHLGVLQALGCNRLQGFHIGRPEPAEEFRRRLAQPPPERPHD